MWQTSDVAEYLGLTREAIQQSSRYFADILSSSAAPASGVTRQFTPRDVALLEFLHSRTRQGRTRDEAAAELRQALEAGQLAQVDAYPGEAVPDGVVTEAEYIRDTAALEAAARLERERADKAEAEAGALRQAVAGHVATIAELRRQLETAAGREEKIGQLQREIGRLEAEIAILRSQS